ncbi:MAG: SDR family oxidoreductase [Burkholderiales bacterium]|nr:SDR family oxidoreductase [Burkholderiales bacterium]
MTRLALITGAARGIGAAVATRLAKAGYRIAVSDLDLAACRSVVDALPGSGHNAWRLDVTSEAEVASAFDAIEAAEGPISILICNAGLLILRNGERPLVIDTSLKEWEATHAVNTTGTFLCAREYLRRRTAKPVEHGRIVTFSSCAAQLGGYRSSAAYISSKSAILGLTKALAREAAPLRITANGVAPGLIDTDMLRLSMRPGTESRAAENIPLGRIGKPDDIASMIEFLVSEGAGYVTGTMNDVNGGYRMQ